MSRESTDTLKDNLKKKNALGGKMESQLTTQRSHRAATSRDLQNSNPAAF